MKRNIIILIFLLIHNGTTFAQQAWFNTINERLSVAADDSIRVMLLSELSNYYKHKRPDSSLYYGYRALQLARDIDFPLGEVRAMTYISMAYDNLGNDSKALQIALRAKTNADRHNLFFNKAFIMISIGDIYLQSGDYKEAMNLYRESNLIFDSLRTLPFIAFTNNKIGNTYYAMNLLDSALYFCIKAYDQSQLIDSYANGWIRNPILLSLGKIQSAIGNEDQALEYYKGSLSLAREAENYFNSRYAISQQFLRLGMPDSSIIYAQQSLNIAEESGFYSHSIEASLLLTDLYEKANPQRALSYSKMAVSYNDSLNNLVKKTMHETFIDFDEEERQREIEAARSESRNRIRINAFLGSSFTLMVIAILLYWNNRQKQRSGR